MIKKCWLILFLLLGINSYGKEIAKDSFRREIIQINYIDAADVVAVFKNEIGTLPEKSRVYVDTKTNVIIANLPAKQLDKLRIVVVRLDKPLVQVKLSTYVVEVIPSYTLNLKEAIKKIEYKQLPLLFAEMEKNGKGKILSNPVVTGDDIQRIRVISYPMEIPYCECTIEQADARVEKAMKLIQQGYNFSLGVTPEIVDKEHLKLNIQLGYIADPDKKEAKEKQLIKEAINHQPIFIDELNELLERKDKQIIFIITPFITYPD